MTGSVREVSLKIYERDKERIVLLGFLLLDK
jgi:hypothetical protein